MFGFLLKKSFCDGWDNLLSVIITNVIFLFLGIGTVFLNAFSFATQNQLLMILAFVLGTVILSIVALAYGESAAENRLFCILCPFSLSRPTMKAEKQTQ